VEAALYEHDTSSLGNPAYKAERSGGSPGEGNPQSPDFAAQMILARVLLDPERQLMSHLKETYPNGDITLYAPILRSSKDLLCEVSGSQQKSTEGDPSPTLLDRLSFCWRLLRQADILARKPKKSEIPRTGGIQHAASVFQNLLPVPLHPPLLSALISKLRLGEDARYLHHYSAFRKASTPTQLPPPFDRIAKAGNNDLLRDLIWWCVRARKEQYVEARSGEQVRIEFAYVIGQVIRDLTGWCGSEIEAFPGLIDLVERGLSEWLVYSRLDLSTGPTAVDTGLDHEIAKAFLKCNELTTKLQVHRSGPAGAEDERVLQLEAQVRQYAEENRQLEEHLRDFQRAHIPVRDVDMGADLSATQFAELREVLMTIDAKYGFDILNSVQLGENTPLTLRSFVSHLFYALRKRGLSEYPKEEQFALPYETSGLYDCDGFEVPPSGSTQVRVSRKGWAFNVRGRWLPVRRARVVAMSPDLKQ